MQFPHNNHGLEEIFIKASVPDIGEFNGSYIVDMLTVLPSLKIFSHRKFFYAEDNKVSGYNMFFNNKRWGNFFLEEGICKDVAGLPAVVINYNYPGNSFISNRMLDYVRCIEHGRLYIGRFNYFIMGKLRFLGYFSLESAPAIKSRLPDKGVD